MVDKKTFLVIARALHRRAARGGVSQEMAEKAKMLAEYFDALAVDPAADLHAELRSARGPSGAGL